MERTTLHPRPEYRSPDRGAGSASSPRPPFRGNAKPKGHDAILKDLQDAGSLVEFVFSSDGSKLVGKIVARDKFTISVLQAGGAAIASGFYTVPTVIYKHALERFSMVIKAPSA